MPGFPFGFMPDPEDPDVQAALLRQKQAEEDMQIKNLEWKDNFAKFLKRLSQDEVEVLSNVFYHLTRQPDAAHFYLGLIHAVGTLKYDTCPMCAEDHAEDLHKDVEEELKRAVAEDPFLGGAKVDLGPVVLTELETTVDQMSGEPPTFGELSPEVANQTFEHQPDIPAQGQLTLVEQKVVDFEFDNENPDQETVEAIRKVAYVPPPDPIPGDMVALMNFWGLDDAWEGDESSKTFKGYLCTRCKRHTFASIQDRMLRANDTTGCPGCLEKEKWG
jgi:hypothetical protein